MLGEKASEYYGRGDSCSVCIFKAYEDVFEKRLPQCFYKISTGINNGFGIGAMCGAAVACVMVLGYVLHGEAAVKQARIHFLSAMQDGLKSTACGKLKKDCRTAIYECGELLEKTIDKFR